MTELPWMSARELLAGYREHAFRPTEVLSALVPQIGAIDHLNAFSTLSLELADQQARLADAAWMTGKRIRHLEGVPVAVKDLFDTAGIRTTYGSSMFSENVPKNDAAVVTRARNAGALILGKTSTHEFGWGITTNNPHFGATRNSWDPERIPGGSSGGSAVALASGATGEPDELGDEPG
jgi:Asp-tRNA(Asn)/Glu-tRNA(Gln) amidotransferase A subunit family amidase